MTDETELTAEEVAAVEPKYQAIEQKMYAVDWDKVETLEDIKVVLRLFDIKFTDDFDEFEQLKPYTKDAGSIPRAVPIGDKKGCCGG